MTTAPFAELGRHCPWFDHVRIDERPRWKQPGSWLRLRKWLRASRFDRVYDLQTQGRTGLYFRLFWPGPWPEWSGIAPGCSHPHRDPTRETLHASDLYAGQLADAGIPVPLPPADLSWLDADLGKFALPERIALLVPGSAPHRLDKRWPAGRFAQLALGLVADGLTPVILGGGAEQQAARVIQDVCPGAIDLTARTSLFELGAIGRRAAVAIGNDTGPMHLIAAAGCPSVVLFSQASDPARAAPRADKVRVLQQAVLEELPVAMVRAEIDRLLAPWSGLLVR